MIDRASLLRDLQREVKALEDDLRERAVADGPTDARLRREHTAARSAGRTAEAFESWRDDQVTQAAVAWVLACVFVRFLEDNHLLPEPLLSGPGDRRQLALDHRQLFFHSHPTDTDREYLREVFRSTAQLPAAGDLLGEKHNPLWSLAPSGDGAARLLDFFQRIPPETGRIAHDFTDPDWNTRFLGDLYQDLSEAARKKFALLQTPEFVEEFILDRTLSPAIEEFGYKAVTLIDPTCGSGHFLLGAFQRLFALHVRNEPATNPRALAQRTLDQISGVDVNPFAVAIARFRLLLAALKVSRIERLADAPGFRMHLAAGDSLLHGRRFGLATMNLQTGLLQDDPLRHVYEAEDAAALKEILGRQYHAVVGNPPYITVKDKALNEAYRDAYSSCHMKYSLGVPFTERFFELALACDGSHPAGFVGMITANSFMKREFGKKLIEQALPKLDLTHVIDTSGAYIPGHGTPTVIFFGRNRAPVAADVRTVMGIRGEPSTPDDPAQGQVWLAITGQLDTPGSESAFVSVADYPRSRFSEHPWSLGGGGAAELKELIEAAADKRLGDVIDSIGFASFTGLDDAFVFRPADLSRRSIAQRLVKPFVYGEAVRDWATDTSLVALVPYDKDLERVPLASDSTWARLLWPLRTSLGGVRSFGGKSRADLGEDWWTWYRWVPEKYRTPLSIAFAFVATHNHFVLDRGGKVFNRSAPVIKLPPDASEDDHLALLALLNSSTACFWMRQVTQPKTQTTGMDQDGWRVRREFDGTKLRELPIPSLRPLELARRLDELARDRQQAMDNSGDASDGCGAGSAHTKVKRLTSGMIALQEELDWLSYRLYGLTDEDCLASPSSIPTTLRPAERAFAIVLGRRLTTGEIETTWFDEHGYQPVTALPEQWSEQYRRVVEHRIEWIESDRNIGLIEQPEYKRRWNTEPFEVTKQRALRSWLLDRLETSSYWPTPDGQPQLATTARLADRAAQDADFMQVAELLEGHPDFDVADLVRNLVEDESAPAVPACRYKPAGLRKRAVWERTWNLQREEDAIDARTALDASDPEHLSEREAAALKKKKIGDIPVPPKYDSGDFLQPSFWRLRGKLDVPKERFVSFPHCEREADPSPVVAWAGWDHLQLAKAVAAYFVARKDQDAWDAGRLTPLLVALAELVPWLRQWHNDLDPEYGVGMGDYFAGFLDTQCQALGLTAADLAAWTPPKGNAARRKKKTARKTA